MAKRKDLEGYKISSIGTLLELAYPIQRQLGRSVSFPSVGYVTSLEGSWFRTGVRIAMLCLDVTLPETNRSLRWKTKMKVS